MALELRDVTLEGDNAELDDMLRRFRWSLALTVPILTFMMSEFLPGQPLQRAMPPAWMTWAQFALATPVVSWGGWPFFVRGWASVLTLHLNRFTLIALGVGAAFADWTDEDAERVFRKLKKKPDYHNRRQRKNRRISIRRRPRPKGRRK